MATTTTGDAPLRRGLSLPNMADPRTLVDLGVRAEAAGWDGVFLWDHLHGSPAFPVPMADAWAVLAALAVRTERVRLGTTITPLALRQPHKTARETVTVDHLSGGRAVLGVGLGEPPEEHTAYGGTAEPRTVAAALDEALDVVTGLWSGQPFSHTGERFTVRDAQYLPPPVHDRIPVWAGCTLPHSAPLRRAARHDGLILAALDAGAVEPVGPDAVAAAVRRVTGFRPADAGPLAVAVAHPGLPTADEQAALVRAGATWVLATGWLDELDQLVGAP